MEDKAKVRTLNTPEGIWRTITSTDSSVHGRVPVA